MNSLDAHYKYFLDPPLHASPVAVRVEIPGPGKFLLASKYPASRLVPSLPTSLSNHRLPAINWLISSSVLFPDSAFYIPIPTRRAAFSICLDPLPTLVPIFDIRRCMLAHLDLLACRLSFRRPSLGILPSDLPYFFLE
ncbi:hypothetical protein ARMSODRAFT_332981 [Armillaria solidipes]|uniref:Uncharacterized protein n=1 Tax=Armillaria solidipes TaxID=1076256 RepID=A0A2H3BDH7_9AGAR|nr:hypothetical protein ARMSODRAFT_332981 [Armillaria solidipes]